MKEFDLMQGLTNQPQTPYSKGGEIFMAETGEQPPQRPQNGGAKESAAPQENLIARKDWTIFKGDFEKLEFTERQAIEKAIDTGRGPFTPEEIKRINERYGVEWNNLSDEDRKSAVDEIMVERDGAGGGKPPEKPPAPPTTPPEEPNHQNENLPQDREPLTLTDKKAAELISRFMKEGGERDRGKGQQLKNDLSQRIDELMKEQWALGDSEEAKIRDGEKEGELTKEAAAKIDELNGQINQIQEAIAERVSGQERSRRGDPEVGRIVGESEEFVNGLRGRGLRLDQINDLARLTPGEKAKRDVLVSDIKKFIHNAPSLESSSFDPDILLAVRHFKELREELISDIIFKSFEDRSETNDYEVNLYADSNLNTLLGFMSKDDNKRYRDFFSLRTATRFFQSMNATVLKGTFDSFGHSAENINYQHFENMRDIRGSGLAMRLYEQAYGDILASDERVTQDKITEIKEFVEKTFKDMNGVGLITSEYSKYRTDSKMENWEVQRALAAGRSFFNITLRAAEIIATGQVPTDRKRYTSPPQEDMVRILNWNQWFLARFGVGGDMDGRHGVEFLEMTTKRYQEFLRYKGAKLGVNRIAGFGGVDVKKMEDGSQYRTSGVYSGWRLENMAFDRVYFDLNGSRISVQQFMDTELIPKDLLERLKKKDVADFLDKEKLEKGEVTVLEAVKAFKKAIVKRGLENRNEGPVKWVEKEDQELYKDILMPAVNNLNYGLSMLIKNQDFGAQDNKLGYLLREEIWKKIARTNTPLMMNYLTGVKYADNTPDAEKAKSIDFLRKNLVPEWGDERWKDFKRKVLIRFERTIREGMGEKLPPETEEFSAEEKKIEDAIKAEGEKLAPHLADIVFAYTPFMNDMPFEKFKYDIAGQTFYKRRTTGDLGGYNKGQQAFTKIMGNPGGIAPKEAVEAMKEIVEGIASPEGPKAGIESNFPTFSALLDIATTDPGKRQAIVKMLLEFGRKETSIAQRWSGIKASSFIESEAANLIDEALREGILTPELAKYLKKEKELTLPFILWMLFRDVFIMTPVFAGSEIFEQLKKG